MGPCRKDPQRTRLPFLHESGASEAVNGRELIQRSEALGRRVVGDARSGDRVLLAFPAGIDFVVSFLGSVYAGLIPVPVPYPKPRRPLSRYQVIAEDSSAVLGLTNWETLERVESKSISSLRWLSPSLHGECDESLMSSRIHEAQIQPRNTDTLFLQYTSGRLASPKAYASRYQI